MIFDTDVLIWCFRANERAARVIQACKVRSISAVTLMELHQGARNKSEQMAIGRFLRELDFRVILIDENISHRACHYVDQFSLKASLKVADALIAATAVERADTLCTANVKHYRVIEELALKAFKPTAP